MDKTTEIYKLVSKTGNAVYVISRPRRFGKLPMLPTQKMFFEERLGQFQGLSINTLPYDRKLANEAEAKRYFLLFFKFIGANISDERLGN